MGDDVAAVREFFAAFVRRDADALAAAMADDGVFQPLSTDAAPRGAYLGPEGMRTYLRDLEETWRQFDVTVSEMQEVDGHVLVTGRIYARARASSLVADDPVAFVWQVRDGHVVWGAVFSGDTSARAAIADRKNA